MSCPFVGDQAFQHDGCLAVNRQRPAEGTRRAVDARAGGASEGLHSQSSLSAEEFEAGGGDGPGQTARSGSRCWRQGLPGPAGSRMGQGAFCSGCQPTTERGWAQRSEQGLGCGWGGGRTARAVRRLRTDDCPKLRIRLAVLSLAGTQRLAPCLLHPGCSVSPGA